MTSHSSSHRTPTSFIIAALIIIGVSGIAAGVAFHDPIHAFFTPPAQRAPAAADDDGHKQLWTCGMHPQVIRDKPGDCPICHMKLTPLNTTGAASANGSLIVTIDPVLIQNMGVRVAAVKQGPLRRIIRAVGYLHEAEPNIHDINLRVSGWVEKLHANTEGMHIRKGDPLFDLYSPDLQLAIEELIATRRSAAAIQAQSSNTDALTHRTSDTLVDTAEQKLKLWGIDQSQIDSFAKLDHAPRTVTFTSPVDAEVTEKAIVEGAAVQSGMRVLRLVDHSTLWLDFHVFDQDLPFVHIGQKVVATTDALPGKEFGGEITFLHPHIDATTRTATVRIIVPNPGMALKPGMYATGLIRTEIAESVLLVPREAVIDSGARQIAFVSLPKGRFEPRSVRMGSAAEDGLVQILEGLKAGEMVVTSGQFLLDSESRIREAIQKHLDEGLLKPDMNTTAVVTPEPKKSAAAAAVTIRLPSPQADALYTAYIEVARTLGELEKDDKPISIGAMIAAADEFAAHADENARPLATEIARAAMEMNAQPIRSQRDLFKPLGKLMVALIEKAPPSKNVAERIFVFECPMAKADWLQISDKIANPFYATDMKQCGDVIRTIKTAAPTENKK